MVGCHNVVLIGGMYRWKREVLLPKWICPIEKRYPKYLKPLILAKKIAAINGLRYWQVGGRG